MLLYQARMYGFVIMVCAIVSYYFTYLPPKGGTRFPKQQEAPAIFLVMRIGSQFSLSAK